MNLRSVRIAGLLWDKPNYIDHWDRDAHEIVYLHRYMEREKVDYFMMGRVQRNIKFSKIWMGFRRLNLSMVDIAKLRAITDKLEEVGKEADAKPFDWPPLCQEIHWLTSNVLVNACDGDLDNLQDVSIGIGTTTRELAGLIAAGWIRRDQAKRILEVFLQPEWVGLFLKDWLWRDELALIIDEAEVDDAMTALIDEVIANNPKAIAEYRAGKEKALGAVIGQIMKQVKADPRAVREAVIGRLGQSTG